MRVVALSTSYPKSPDDSTAPFLRAITRGVASEGWDVDLLLPHHPDLTWNGSDGPVRIHTFRYLPGESRSLHRWGYAGALRADVRLRPTVALIVVPALAAGTARLRSLVRELRPDVIHAHWVLPNGPPAAWVAQRLGVPLVVSLHGSGTFLAERRGVFGAAARYAFRRAAAVTACSSDLARRAIGLGADPQRCRVIPYGADPEAFRPTEAGERREARRSLGLPTEGVLVAAVGRLVEKKGFRYLLEAMAGVRADPEPSLAIAGGGDLEGELRALARRLGVEDRVHFLGNRERDEIGALYRAAEILAVPSVHDSAGNVDGLPNVLLEGLASGLPVVASEVAGIPDVLRDAENGLLVPEKDPEALKAALDRLVSDPALRDRLGGAARRLVEDELAWPAIVARYRDTLLEAAGRAA